MKVFFTAGGKPPPIFSEGFENSYSVLQFTGSRPFVSVSCRTKHFSDSFIPEAKIIQYDLNSYLDFIVHIHVCEV